MAREDDLDLDTEGEVEAPKSKSKLLLIALAVVLFLGVSAALTLVLTGMFSGGQEAVAADAHPADTKVATAGSAKSVKSKPPLTYIPLDPPFVVNFHGDSDIRFLQVGLQIGTRDSEAVERIKEQNPAIRNSLVMLFSGQDPHVLNTREGKEKLRADALVEIQKVMKAETGTAAVEGVFFTSFVMQ
jgi:flagellar FliL protein